MITKLLNFSRSFRLSPLYLLCLLALPAAAIDIPFLSTSSPATFEGIESPALAKSLKRQLSAYQKTLDKTPETSTGRRVQTEIGLIKKWLRAEGFYQGRVSHSGGQHYRIEPGQRFSVSAVYLSPDALPGGDVWPSLKIDRNQPVRAQAVLADRSELLAFARQHCYPEAQVDYQVTLDDQQHTAEVRYRIKPGVRLHVGELLFTGLVDLHEEYLRNEIDLKPGACLRRSDLDRARLQMLQTGQIASVTLDYDYQDSVSAVESAKRRAQKGANGAADEADATVTFAVTERKRKSVKASVEYTSDTEEGASLGWEHRNLFGNAERLEFEVGADQINKFGTAIFTLPQFYHPRQELQIIADWESEEPEAYSSQSREVATILSRQWQRGRLGSIGVSYTESRVSEDGEGDNYSLVSLPTAFSIDRRDDLLNARQGWWATISVRPYTDIVKEEVDFMQTALAVRYYISEDDWPGRPTLALRSAVGILRGSDVQDIPADHRFYVGGGGSVRGYPYQSVGELTDGEPDGGKSFAEVSGELRWVVAPMWGLVLFTDGGYAYPEDMPSFGEDFLWGAGLGLRYLSNFVPLRIDVAVPLHRRPEVDDHFQLYISFGQAF